MGLSNNLHLVWTATSTHPALEKFLGDLRSYSHNVQVFISNRQHLKKGQPRQTSRWNKRAHDFNIQVFWIFFIWVTKCEVPSANSTGEFANLLCYKYLHHKTKGFHLLPYKPHLFFPHLAILYFHVWKSLGVKLSKFLFVKV